MSEHVFIYRPKNLEKGKKSFNKYEAMVYRLHKGGTPNTATPKILTSWEKKNVNMPAGYQIFRKYFENLIKESDPNHNKKEEEVYDYNGSKREKLFC
jgi:hypothetical protein